MNYLKYFFLACIFAQIPAFAIGEGGDFLVVPYHSAMGGKTFQIRGTAGHHQTACKEGRMCDRYPFVASARLGVSNTIDFGLQFGKTVSLDVKNQITHASGLVPDISIGARAFVQSPEAYFYSVPKKEREAQTGEFYAALGWNAYWWNILGGVSAFPFMDASSVAPFWGFEQNFSPKFGIVYEGFFRRGFSHHNMGISVKPTRELQINAGATEFYRYFFSNDGEFKFRAKNPGASTGYRAPGIYVSIAITGGPGKKHEPSPDSLERLLLAQSADLSELNARLAKLEEIQMQKDLKDTLQAVQKEFDEIAKGYFANDLDLDYLLVKEEIFMGKGIARKNFALIEAQNKSADANNRIAAIRMISHFPDTMFLEPLGSIATESENEAVAREAVLALGVINTPESRQTLASIVNSTSGIVRQTIIDIIGEL